MKSKNGQVAVAEEIVQSRVHLRKGELGKADAVLSAAVSTGNASDQIYAEWVRLAAVWNQSRLSFQRLESAMTRWPKSNWIVMRAFVHQRALQYAEAISILGHALPGLKSEVQKRELTALMEGIRQRQQISDWLAARDQLASPSPYEVLAINLDKDVERWQGLTAQFSDSGRILHRIPGVSGKHLPDAVSRASANASALASKERSAVSSATSRFGKRC